MKKITLIMLSLGVAYTAHASEATDLAKEQAIKQAAFVGVLSGAGIPCLLYNYTKSLRAARLSAVAIIAASVTTLCVAESDALWDTALFSLICASIMLPAIIYDENHPPLYVVR